MYIHSMQKIQDPTKKLEWYKKQYMAIMGNQPRGLG